MNPTIPGTRAPLIPTVMLIVGGYLTWFAVHYWRSSNVIWPSDPVKALLTGKSLPTSTPTDLESNVKSFAAAEQSATAGASAAEQGTGSSGDQQGTAAPVTGDYTHEELEVLWTTLGGSQGSMNIAAAIAQAESSGDPNATSSNPDGGTNVGLWQLDTKGKGAGYTVDELKVPDTNARVTIFASLNGTDWSAWETYVTGAYEKYLSS